MQFISVHIPFYTVKLGSKFKTIVIPNIPNMPFPILKFGNLCSLVSQNASGTWWMLEWLKITVLWLESEKEENPWGEIKSFDVASRKVKGEKDISHFGDE